MFVGTWLQSKAAAHIPRSHVEGEIWTHWKVVLTRERYSDCAPIVVRVDLFDSRKIRGKWVTKGECQITHEVDLGNLNHEDVRSRLRTVDGDRPYLNNPRVVKELKAAIVAIETYGEQQFKQGQPVEIHRLNRLVLNACQKAA